MDEGQAPRHDAESDARGDLASVVDRHVHLVYATCLRQLRDADLADRATQAVFVLLGRQGGRVNDSASAVPGAFDIACQVCRVAEAGVGARGNGSALRPASADWASLSPRIDRAVAALPNDVRRAFLLKYVANLSLREVATALDVADATAGQRISAGVAGLRRQFESQGTVVRPDALVAAVQTRFVHDAPAHVVRHAQLAAASATDGTATPATVLADRVSGVARRGRVMRLAGTAAVVLLLALGAFKLYDAAKNAQLAATRPAPRDTSGASGPAAQRPAPSLPPMPDAPRAAGKPIKPLPPELVDRFLRAIRQGDFESVRALVDGEESLVNATEVGTDRSAVDIAADLVTWNRQDATRIAHFLIENGATTDVFTSARAGHKGHVALTLDRSPQLLDAKDDRGLTPLQRAALVPGASPECEEVVDLLTGAGAKVDVWTASTFGRLADVEEALKTDPGVVDRPCLGATPLNWATRPRRYAADPVAIPKLLIDRGGDVRSRDTANDGMTPLHHTGAWGGQVAVAQLLIDRGVDVNVLDDCGWTPLDYAIDRGRKEMVEFFQSKGGRRTTVDYPNQPSKTARFFAAVEFGDADLVKRLLDDTPELAKTRGPTGETPLHHAAARGSTAIVDLLLADKADVNAEESNKYGGTPLHWAVRHDHPDVVRHLLSRKANPKLANRRNGQTLLHVAARHTDDPALIELLLGTGIDPAAKDRFGRTALEYAQQGGHARSAAKLRGG